MKYIYCVQDSNLFPGFNESILFNGDLVYDTIDSLNDSKREYNLTDIDGYCKAVCQKIVDAVYSAGLDDIIKSIKFVNVKELLYFDPVTCETEEFTAGKFKNDQLELEIDLDQTALEAWVFEAHSNEFAKYLVDNFTSDDGFSYVPNNIDEFKTQYIVEHGQKLGRCLDIMVDFYLLSRIGSDKLYNKFSEIASKTMQEFLPSCAVPCNDLSDMEGDDNN